MPHAAVYSASLPMGMAIPPAPWSPRPEDPLVVGDDDEPDVLVRALAQELRDPVAVGRA